MSVLKKITSFFLLLLVVAPLIGFVLFHFQQKSIRAEMKRAFKTKELSTVKVQQIQWYKKNKEIIVNGTLFDVSTIQQLPDGSYLVKGLYDHQEQELHKLLDNTTRKNQKAPTLLSYASCFVSHSHSFSPILVSVPITQLVIKRGYLETLFAQFKPDILSPPPKTLRFHSLN